MENGTDIRVIKQFDAIAFLQDTWDHNQQYQKYVLQNIPRHCTCILDVGCGTGELTKKLIPYAHEIIAIDVSKNMVEEAQKRNAHEKIRYINISAEKYLAETDIRFDVIVSVAALHHMNEESMLETMRGKLTEKGKIVILDLVKNEGAVEYLLSILAVLVNPIIMVIKRGRVGITKEEREVWAGHFQYDTYVTMKEVRNIVKRALGKAKIKRHFFWRYSIVYSRGV
ncbi:MAG: class I SAM-dependent methyltransferase [Treponema sp.]|nr:class I SAM-dependent methyltransferase [Treponema sp.]